MMTRDTNPTIRRLSDADAQVLDALLEARCGGGGAAPGAGVPGELWSAQQQARVGKVKELLALLDRCSVENAPADLADRTLKAVTEAEQRRRFAYQIAALNEGQSAGRFQIGRWMEIAVGAAMIIVGISLALPMLARNRDESRRVGCAANLAGAGTGFSHYAADNNGSLPRIQGVKPGDVWIRVGQRGPNGQVQSNSAHLYILVRRGYVSPDTLSCPENANAPRNLTVEFVDWPRPQDPSFSYRNQYATSAFRVETNALGGPGSPAGSGAMLADRNPLFELTGSQLAQNPDVSQNAPSRQHGGAGQNILMTTGNVLWDASPVLSNGDNIWTARGIEHYTGTEAPADADDTHLVP